MSASIHPYRSTGAATIAAAFTLLLTAAPAHAIPAPEPDDDTGTVWTCPTRIDLVAETLRAAGFTPQAANNLAILTHHDCTTGT
jgi:hypothetical protein